MTNLPTPTPPSHRRSNGGVRRESVLRARCDGDVHGGLRVHDHGGDHLYGSLPS